MQTHLLIYIHTYVYIKCIKYSLFGVTTFNLNYIIFTCIHRYPCVRRKRNAGHNYDDIEAITARNKNLFIQDVSSIDPYIYTYTSTYIGVCIV